MPPRRVCLFAQYDRAGRIWPHVHHYWRALRASGFEIVVAASGGCAERVEGVTIIPRANAGLDFGAWRDLLRDGHADGAASVLFANDSVYGPLWDLGPTMSAMAAQAPDAWGMVESRQGAWHLQSWFLHLTADALRRPAVQRVFRQDFAPMSKPEIIVRGELALGAALQAEGLRCLAVRGIADATWLARLAPCNPMHVDWRHLVRRHAVPFVKVEVLRDNPMGLPWVRSWPDVLAGSAVPAEWVRVHLHAAPPRPASPAPSLRMRVFQVLATHDRAAALGLWHRRSLPATVASRSVPEMNADAPRPRPAGHVRPDDARA